MIASSNVEFSFLDRLFTGFLVLFLGLEFIMRFASRCAASFSSSSFFVTFLAPAFFAGANFLTPFFLVVGAFLPNVAKPVLVSFLGADFFAAAFLQSLF